MAESAVVRVARGGLELDGVRPGWWRPGVVDLRRLDMSSCDDCLLAQLYGLDGPGMPTGYDMGLAALNLDGLGRDDEARFGFNIPDSDWDDVAGGGPAAFDELRDAWIAEIERRRAAVAVPVPGLVARLRLWLGGLR